jgi:toxin FitB
MLSFLLDTNVISEPGKKRPHPSVVAWFLKNKKSELFISALTIGEIEQGIAHLQSSGTRLDESLKYRYWLEQDLKPRFAGRILPLTAEIATQWGSMSGQSTSKGRTLPTIDSLIAATAIVHGLVLVTRDTTVARQFAFPHVNPWEDSETQNPSIS